MNRIFIFSINLLTFFMIFIILCCQPGCTRYLETETPGARVPPAKEIPENEGFSEAPSDSEAVYEVTDDYAKNVLGDSDKQYPKNFREAYEKMGHPSIMIFLNRELSSDVDSWQSQSRINISGVEKETQRGNENHDKESSWQTEIKADVRKPSVKRSTLEEDWTWEFENGLYNTFLNANVDLIDRNLAIRKLALEQPGKYADEIETLALTQNADILIEVIISQDPSSSLGYEFKGTGKAVQDSKIIFHVTSLDWENRISMKRERIVATDHGYQSEESSEMPSIRDMAANLATDMMIELTQKWSTQY